MGPHLRWRARRSTGAWPSSRAARKTIWQTGRRLQPPPCRAPCRVPDRHNSVVPQRLRSAATARSDTWLMTPTGSFITEGRQDSGIRRFGVHCSMFSVPALAFQQRAPASSVSVESHVGARRIIPLAHCYTLYLYSQYWSKHDCAHVSEKCFMFPTPHIASKQAWQQLRAAVCVQIQPCWLNNCSAHWARALPLVPL